MSVLAPQKLTPEEVHANGNQAALNLVLIGMGGIGCNLDRVIRYVNYNNPGSRVLLVDGDEFEPKNDLRQAYSYPGNKAEAKLREFAERFRNVEFIAVPEYVKPGNFAEVILTGDIVLSGVDNNKTRRWLSDYCITLEDVLLISGGNAFHWGNLQVLMRRGGQVVPPSYPSLYQMRGKDGTLLSVHPEIEHPDDFHPEEEGCTEKVMSLPQLLFANNAVATLMEQEFYRVAILGLPPHGAIFNDLITGKVTIYERSWEGS